MTNHILTFARLDRQNDIAPTQKRDEGAAQEDFEQLSFRFDTETEGPESVIYIVTMDNIHGRKFCDIIIAKKPKIIIDLRQTVRFDLPGTNRDVVFKHFNASNSLYLRNPLPWHELRIRDFILGERKISLRLEHEVAERKQNPVLILAPSAEKAPSLISYIGRSLLSRGEKKFSVIHLNKN
ncbi:hypothetical protein [Stappia sp. WLB 29]|uniref:hypothetical protein n=1 Tax=Stappia sp. WLB 29 TaxID=2925220 RepID=UPI0020BEE1BD|nr:hypothetical protein [Stappia sp. WLB 29]